MDPTDELHARSLFRAISLTLTALGCAPQTLPPANDIVIIVPAASGAPVAAAPPVDTTSSAPPMASASPPTDAPEPSMTASAAPPPPATAKKPPKVVPPNKKRITIDIVEGRPFLVEGTARLAAIASGSGWTDVVSVDAPRDPVERDALVAHYTAWSLGEHASIASFARFSLQLLALGAPSDLVGRATEAMADETRHARFGFGLVRALSGTTLRPAALRVDRALDGETTLEGVLRLAVREGMIGETLAALEVRLAADLAELPSLKEALATISEDESRHAELAYGFAAWALAQAPELAAVIEEEVCGWDAPALPAVAGLDRWGILDEARRQSVRESGFTNVVLPLVAQLTNGFIDGAS